MGGSFSSSSKSSKKKQTPEITDIDRAVLDLKVARDKLSRYKKKLELDEAKLIQQAKKAKSEGKTKTALNILKIKRMKENQVTAVDNQLLNILQMVETISSKENEKEVLLSIQQGKNALEKLHKENTLEQVIELMDQVHEQNELEQEISNVLAGVPELSVEDEATVEAELNELEKEIFGETTPTTTTKEEEEIKLPEVPTTELPEPQPTKKPAVVSSSSEATTSKPERVAVPS